MEWEKVNVHGIKTCYEFGELVLVAVHRPGEKDLLIHNDLNLSSKLFKDATLYMLDEWEDSWNCLYGEGSADLIVGHGLRGDFKKHLDLVKEVKRSSAPILQNEGKRFPLSSLCLWNGVQGRFGALMDDLRSFVAVRRGDHTRLARSALIEARLSVELFKTMRKEARVRFLDANTGQLAYAPYVWPQNTGEEE